MSRTFYSDSVEAALAAARQALGDETILLDAGMSPAQERSKGAYRVVAEAAGEDSRPEGTSPAPMGESRSAHELGSLRRELRTLRSAVESASALAARAYLDGASLARTPELAPCLHSLLEAGMPPELVQSIADSAGRRLNPEFAGVAAPQARAAVAAELESRIEVLPGFGKEGAARKIVALAGPAGAGKTTTLAKLAMNCAVTARKSAAVLSLDIFRIGAADQLKALASILGLPFHLCETPADLQRSLAGFRQKEMIFIDTPGAGPAELEWWHGFAPHLAGSRDVETQLVLPATASCRQLISWIRQNSPVQPARLIFTHLDEAALPGAFIAAALMARLPISFLAAGQAIPEDLEPATKAKLLGLAIGRAAAAHAAA